MVFQGLSSTLIFLKVNSLTRQMRLTTLNYYIKSYRFSNKNVDSSVRKIVIFFKIHFVLYMSVCAYASTIVFNDEFTSNCLPLMLARKIHDGYYFMMTAKFLCFSISFLLCYFIVCLPYITSYEIFYIAVLLKIYSNHLKTLTSTTAENINQRLLLNYHRDLYFQKLTKWRLVFLIQRHLELVE